MILPKITRREAGDGDLVTDLPRQRLVQRIAPGDGACPPVTTLVAPVGYGKSSLLRAVADAHTPGLALYVSLADCEHHPALFLDLLASEARRSGVRVDLAPLLMLKKAAPVEEYGDRLPRVLARVFADVVDDRPLTLLLDECQDVRAGEPLAQLVAGLLRAEVQRPNLVLSSRRQLPFDLTRHRAQGLLLELTAHDLSFTVDEVGLLLEQIVGREVPVTVAEKAWNRTRGWGGVVMLLGSLMRGRSDDELAALVDGFDGEEEALADLVVNRLLAEYRPPVRYLLKVISILERVDLRAVKALLGTQGARTASAASRSFIALPDVQISDYLQRLERTQVLIPTGRPDGTLELNPLVRDVLARILEREDPRVFREAHHRAAEHYLSTADGVDSVSLDHLVAAGDYERVLGLLEAEAEGFFTGGYHRQLSHWLRSLESHYSSLPFWACYYLGRIYAALGEWDRARRYLDRCKADLSSRAGEGDLWRWQPRVCLGFATMYWRRGMTSEAGTYCRRGLDFLRQLRRRGGLPEEHVEEAARVNLELLHLLGTLKMETGVYDKARLVCEEARDFAADAGLQREEAVAHKNLGLIAMYRGAMRAAGDHLRIALSKADRDADPELHAEIAFDLGRTQMVTGEPEAALSSVRDALAQVIDSGHPATIVHMHAVLGGMQGEAGEQVAADKSFRAALRMLDGVGDVKVRAEVLDRYAGFLARNGRIDEASLILDQAAPLVEGLLRTEVHVGALHAEALAEFNAASGELTKAVTHLKSAIDRYQRIGAEYDVARLQWRAAVWHHRSFVAGDQDTPEAVAESLAAACAAAESRGYSYQVTPESHELLHVGIAYGEEGVRDRCLELLRVATGGEPGEEWGAESLSAEASSRYRDYRRRAELADDYVISARDGRRGANARQVEELIDSRGDDALILLTYEQTLINRGSEISLSEKRVIMPLLLHFLSHPDAPFTMDALAADVWGSKDGRQAMQTKVKVAISRLRGLLGKDRAYVNTTRVPVAGGGTVVAYALADDLEFYVVDRSEED